MVRLEADAERTMFSAARSAAPKEACGLLFGDGAHILEASVAANIAADPRNRFEIDPAHLFDAQRRDRAGPLRLLGCWHAHPDGSAIPSRHDFAGAQGRAWLWLIVAGGSIRGWWPGAGGFAEIALLRPGL